MLLTTLTEITDIQRIQRVQRLYQHDIAALETLGFRVLTYYEEAWQPDSLLHVPLFFGRALWNLWFNRERESFGWQPPFTLCLHHPVLIHEESGTFAHVFGLGTCYMAGFLNGGLLMSATYNVMFQSRPELHYYRETNADNPTISGVWKTHKRKLQSLKNDGYLLYPELTFGLYTELNALNERVVLGMRKTKD